MKKIFGVTLLLIIISVSLTLWSWFNLESNANESSYIDAQDTIIIAHRGNPSGEVENTLKAFQKSGEMGYEGIECDVRFTKDGVPIIFHDENIKKLTGVDITINDTNYNDLKDITFLKDETQTIPLFEDYLNICANFNTTAVIELKDESYTDEHIQLIFDLIQASNVSSFKIISFELEPLLQYRRLDSETEIQYLGRKYTPRYLQECIEYQFIPSVDYKSLTPTIIEIFHKNNLKVGCWTVNDSNVALNLIELGVNYITTNDIHAK